MSQISQPGELVATRVQDQGSGAVLHGAALIARRDEPLQSEATDLSNVVPFARPRRQGASEVFPLPAVSANERPAPPTAKFGIGRSIALLVGSLALHSALLAMFWHQPRPMASIGIEAISVEIVVGATTAAGTTEVGEQEVRSTAAPDEQVQEETEHARAATVMPQEVAVAPQETAPEAKPQETPAELEIVEPTLPEQRPEVETAVADSPAPQRPQIQTVQKAPERKRIAAPTDKKSVQKKQAAAAPSNVASGAGVGRSDKSANYAGIVRAHFLRQQRRLSGTGKGAATVQFLLDGGGRVTSARLVRSSGVAAFDQEIVAMARRASPFPPPPDGKGGNFTVSVNFEVR